jgi:hypothetical protein
MGHREKRKGKMKTHWVTVCAALFIPTALTGAEAPKICAMSEQQAAQSPLCVQWYFICMLDGQPTRPPTGFTVALDPPTRQRLLIFDAFRAAKKKCDIFSLEEALSAARARLPTDDEPPPVRID